MANVLVENSSLENIADAIRDKLETADTYKPGEMADAIASIPTGSIINNQNKTAHASTASQEVTADEGYTGLGKVTIPAVTLSNLTAANIVKDVRVKIGDADDDDRIANVLGTADTGGITPTGTKQISISSNGVTTHDVTSYASAEITAAVANTYSAGDEGKVVSNGALVAQTSDTVTQNGTVDTTLINSLTVNVSGGGGGQTATGTINLATAGNVATFSCSFEPKVVCIQADDQATTFATRHLTDYYVHFGFCALIRGMNANSTSKTNYVAALGDYQLGTTFSTYYKVSYSNGTVTVQGRSGYGFLAGTDTTYTWRAVGY